MSDPRSEAALLEELRPAAFAIAYRMLGSVAEAEDVVQEALLRLHRGARGRRAYRVAARVSCRPWSRGSSIDVAALGAGAA